MFGYFISVCGLAALSLYLAISWRFSPLILFFLFFLGFACFSGYRFFCFSDDWYRTINEREAIWARHHPRLQIFLVVLGAIGVIWQITEIIRRHH